MTRKIKNFFSFSFSALAIVALASGLVYLPIEGWDVSQYYFYGGFVLSVIAQVIEISMAEDDN